MLEHRAQRVGLSDADLDFVVREAAPDAADTEHLKRLIAEDEAFRMALVGDERIFARVMADEEIFLRISPALYFEVLLRRALVELEQAVYTLEYDRAGTIPVFDTSAVVQLLARRGVVGYLADMLSSFTRVRVSVTAVRVRRGIWRRVRTSDMDIDSLVRMCSTAEPEQRFAFYKRIADVCLFVSGLFPHSARGVRGSSSRRGARLDPGGAIAAQPRGVRGGGPSLLRARSRAPRGPGPGAHGRPGAPGREFHDCHQAPALHRLPLPALQGAPALCAPVRLGST